MLKNTDLRKLPMDAKKEFMKYAIRLEEKKKEKAV